MRTLLERRIPQLVGVYLVGSWGFVQFVDWAQRKYALSPDLTNFVVALALLLLPAALFLAWRHGAPGPDRWSRTDGAFLTTNLLLAAIVLFIVFGGRSLGATTTTLMVRDEEGHSVERVVARDAFRRKLFLPWFDNATGDTTLNWLRLGVPAALDVDLAQDLFVQGESPVGVQAKGLHVELARAGVSGDAHVPLPLALRLARERHLDHVVWGRLVHVDSGLEAEIEVYDTQHGRRVARRTISATGPFALVDALTEDLKHDLGVPAVQLEASQDLPVAELVTSSAGAFRDYILSEQAAGAGDLAAQARHLRRAVAQDSTFAAAQLALAMLLVDTQPEEARSAMRSAMAHAYRLPESRRLEARTIDAWLFQKDVDRATQTARYWADLYPDDMAAHRSLADLYQSRGDWKAAAEQFETILALDPGDYGTLLNLSLLYLTRGDFERALRYQQRYVDLVPDNADAFQVLGNLYMYMGQRTEARRAYEHAALIAPEDPSLRLNLAVVAIHEGDYAAASRIAAKVLTASRTAADSTTAFRTVEWIAYRTGRGAAMDSAWRARAALVRETSGPGDAALQLLGWSFIRFAGDWGRAGRALALLDSLAAGTRPPVSDLLAVMLVPIRAELGDTTGARRGLEIGERAIKAYGLESERYRLEVARGLLAERAGDYSAAVGHYRRAIELSPILQLPRLYLGRSLREAGRAGEAMADLRDVLQVSPGNASAHLEMARTLAALGRSAAARAEADTALSIWKDADLDFRPAREADALRNGGD